MTTISTDVKTLEHSTLKVPYEVLNKRFRTAQKILDREAAYVAQAGSEVEKLIGEVPLPSRSSMSVLSGFGSTSRSLDAGDSHTEGPILVESSINVQSIAALLAGVKDGSGEPMVCDNPQDSSVIKGENEMDAEEPGISTNNRIASLSKRSMSDNGHGMKMEHSRARPKVKDVAKLLGVLVERLGSLKRKAGDSIQEELEAANTVRKRVQHLKSYTVQADAVQSSPSQSNAVQKSWKRSRLNRMLIDHLLREGMYDTARMLADDLGIKELTNVDVFWAAKEVEESLKRHETGRMVQWCYENKSKLRKIRSTLELEIRVQEFIELVRHGRRNEAVKHARKYLADSEGEEYISAVKKCMGLLAFPVSTSLSPYAELFSPDRWNQLIAHFRQEHARLYQLAPNSVLEAVVQAGLAALKTPQCYRSDTKNTNCPVCTDPLSALALHLPYAHCAHSQLVCAISGEPINENNPPLVLPSSFVYGSNALHEMAKNNSGKVICPRSNKVFSVTEAEKVYVM
ncbi:unnamed protein product [Orchesella dallaii]|uniref:E3 ubiquitin-protein transferase MAEA n=1 Tax=Orchesella dallaii TaxID=48710 RepID=A0ABP1SAG3_9HEXA